ncbi:MAG: hypothetical protein OXI97_05950 [Acidimicrobiaceae bacterium]|nr:hypothetical protein [Acidimicrobiaceae bacterium]
MAGRRGEQGLVALDWMLIFAGVVGAAVGASVLVQNLFEEAAYEREDPIVRVIEADIAAARIAAEAQRLFEKDRDANRPACEATPPMCTPIDFKATPQEPGTLYTASKASSFAQGCETDLMNDFSDVLDAGMPPVWHDPVHPWHDPNDPSLGLDDDKKLPARCVLTPRPNLVQ